MEPTTITDHKDSTAPPASAETRGRDGGLRAALQDAVDEVTRVRSIPEPSSYADGRRDAAEGIAQAIASRIGPPTLDEASAGKEAPRRIWLQRSHDGSFENRFIWTEGDVEYVRVDRCSSARRVLEEAIGLRPRTPQMDWQQVALNGGPPCFAVLPDSPERFCGRAAYWAGHDSDHRYVSLADLLAGDSEGYVVK